MHSSFEPPLPEKFASLRHCSKRRIGTKILLKRLKGFKNNDIISKRILLPCTIRFYFRICSDGATLLTLILQDRFDGFVIDRSELAGKVGKKVWSISSRTNNAKSL